MARPESQQPPTITAAAQRTLAWSAQLARSATGLATTAAARSPLVQASAIPWLLRYTERPRGIGVLADSLVRRFALGTFRMPDVELTLSRFGSPQRQLNGARRSTYSPPEPRPPTPIAARVVAPDAPDGMSPVDAPLYDPGAHSWTPGGGVRPPSEPGPAASAPSGGPITIGRQSRVEAPPVRHTQTVPPMPFATAGAGPGDRPSPQPATTQHDLLERSTIPARSVAPQQFRASPKQAAAGVQRLPREHPLQRIGLTPFTPAISRLALPIGLPLAHRLPAVTGTSRVSRVRSNAGSPAAIGGLARLVGGERIARAVLAEMPGWQRTFAGSLGALQRSTGALRASPLQTPGVLSPSTAPPLPLWANSPAAVSRRSAGDQALPRLGPQASQTAHTAPTTALLSRLALAESSPDAPSQPSAEWHSPPTLTAAPAPAGAGEDRPDAAPHTAATTTAPDAALQRVSLAASGLSGDRGRSHPSELSAAVIKQTTAVSAGILLRRTPLVGSELDRQTHSSVGEAATNASRQAAGSAAFGRDTALQRLPLAFGVFNSPMNPGGISRIAMVPSTVAARIPHSAILQRADLHASSLTGSPESQARAAAADRNTYAATTHPFPPSAPLRRMPLAAGTLGGSPQLLRSDTSAALGSGLMAGAAPFSPSAPLRRMPLAASTLDGSPQLLRSDASAALGSGQGADVARFLHSAPLRRMPLATSTLGGFPQARSDANTALGNGLVAGAAPFSPSAPLLRMSLAIGTLGGFPQTRSDASVDRGDGHTGSATSLSPGTLLQRLALAAGALNPSDTNVTGGYRQATFSPSAPLRRTALVADSLGTPLLARTSASPSDGNGYTGGAASFAPGALLLRLPLVGQALHSPPDTEAAGEYRHTVGALPFSSGAPLLRMPLAGGTLGGLPQMRTGASTALGSEQAAQADRFSPGAPLLRMPLAGGTLGGLAPLRPGADGSPEIAQPAGGPLSFSDAVLRRVGLAADNHTTPATSALPLFAAALPTTGIRLSPSSENVTSRQAALGQRQTTTEAAPTTGVVDTTRVAPLAMVRRWSMPGAFVRQKMEQHAGALAQQLPSASAPWNPAHMLAEQPLPVATGRAGALAGNTARGLVDDITAKVGEPRDMLNATQGALDLPLVSPRQALGPASAMQAGAEGAVDAWMGQMHAATGGATSAGRLPLELALSQNLAAPAMAETPGVSAQGATASAPAPGNAGAAEPDIEALAQKVYDHLRRTTQIEQERLGRW
ncbi:MAG TPA: hypothetical protein VFS21_10700 [Roseiflexaceae bacterium]|nr:hypothetical protein [Roseiflexaceae bacterium]